jgi:succinate dehydrogenase/fumarate reductase flavoprotein subunit
VAVNAAGRRFVDESVSSHRFVRAVYATQDAVPAWLVVDAHTLKRYGLGMIRPHAREGVLRRHVEDGYLHIEKPPFSAIAVVPTPLATTLGLRIDANAQVLTEHGDPVRGLYACGNDAMSMTASEYPGAGCQVGTGLVFGYLAAKRARLER